MGSLVGALYLIEGDSQKALNRAMEFMNSTKGRKLQASVSSGGGIQKKDTHGRSNLYRRVAKFVAASRALRRESLLSSKILRELVHALIPDIDIRDLPVPFQITTVDLRSGNRVVLSEGSLRIAIRASMSIPGVFPAVRQGDQLLSDIGGL